ncbi:ImmA/IrrE family metallo-endopeptidase [Acinetobacter nectaris]|uniref:ImmA/IrrE family metallo-endopeptidase n=1 Tax=Acinetobacter nectaris TaxID=1219382 RepID=UPI001F2FEB75|nr:ImmA/IrrE family metallo-endopeptidase [Acinetobacter nectaris]MCF8999831.1 ImmA/IrrE family metallo-endopeptidase [Acinetobacter nectaris]MCF9026744.1 ImmA/IrrE family metallo-endopeptidase [Acinetobacter nectaris]
MSMHVDISTLNFYVKNSQISLDVLKSKIKNLDQFLTGEKQPSFTQLSDIAKKINVPTGLLLLNKTIDLDVKRLDFRTLDSDSIGEASEELRDTIVEMEVKQEFLRNEVSENLDFVGQFSIDSNFLDVANQIRNKLELPIFFQNQIDNPLNYLRSKINDIGVFVFFNGKVKDNTHRPLSVKEFRGFVLLDEKVPIIFINQKDTKNGQFFTLAHELVHIFVGTEEIFNFVDAGDYQFNPTEAFVNKVTAEILVPEESFLSFNSSDSSFLAKKFKVSEFVIVRRLLDLNKITHEEYRNRTKDLMNKLEKLLPSESNGGSYQNNTRFRVDNKFFKHVMNAVNHDRISYTDAFNIIGVGFKGYKILMNRGGND